MAQASSVVTKSLLNTDIQLATLCNNAYSQVGHYTAGDVSVLRLDISGKLNGYLDTVLVFRGTQLDNPRDISRDLSIWPRYNKDVGYCHDGFLTGAESVASSIIADMVGRNITITGHSLGGAMAGILAGILIGAGLKVDSLVTFGCPRMTWDRWLRFKLWKAGVVRRRYRRMDDDVPEIPLFCGHLSRRLDIGSTNNNAYAAHEISGYISDLQKLYGSVVTF